MDGTTAITIGAIITDIIAAGTTIGIGIGLPVCMGAQGIIAIGEPASHGRVPWQTH